MLKIPKFLLFFTFSCVLLVGLSPAMGGLNLLDVNEYEAGLDIKWGWNPEEEDAHEWGGTWWTTKLTVSKVYTEEVWTGWNAELVWTHVGIHGEDLFTDGTGGQFGKDEFGLVIDTSGAPPTTATGMVLTSILTEMPYRPIRLSSLATFMSLSRQRFVCWHLADSLCCGVEGSNQLK